MTDWSVPISLDAYDVAWETRFGTQTEKPAVLDCESPGETATARNRVRRQAAAELNGPGGLPDWLLDALAGPDEAYSLRWDTAQPIRVLAVRSGNAHVVAAIGDWPRPVATTPGPAISFRLTPDGDLPAALISLLPRQPAAKLRAQSIRLSSLAKIGGEVRAHLTEARERPVTFVAEQLRSCGESREASDAFARLAAGRSSGRGELTVSVGHGARRTTDHKVMVNDVEGKRYLVITRAEHVTISGANNRDLIDIMYRELGDLGRTVYR